MARLLQLRPSFLRIYRNAPPFPSPLFSASLLPRPISRSCLPLPFHSAVSSFPSAASSSDVVFPPTSDDEENNMWDSSSGAPHPWPEWDQFLQRLQTKGYFAEATAPPPPVGSTAVISSEDSDIHRVKTACLLFGRDRIDILESLSKENIRALVQCGCPSRFRKVLNAAKRLRVFLGLEEEKMVSCCQDCIKIRTKPGRENTNNATERACPDTVEESSTYRTTQQLRAIPQYRFSLPQDLHSMPTRAEILIQNSVTYRAYLIPKGEEGAHTIDIVRILLSYASDPLVLSKEAKPSSVEHIEASARKLVSELIELSDRTPDQDLPKPVVKFSKANQHHQKLNDNHRQAQNVEMKKGDWTCLKNTQYIQEVFAIPNIPSWDEEPSYELWRKDSFLGDPLIAQHFGCNFVNFARNIRCLACKEDGPRRVDPSGIEMKSGDWICPQCQFMNFARNNHCFRCRTSRPYRELKPGDWECPSCNFPNFRRNTVCLKCKNPNPSKTDPYAGHIWRKPGVPSTMKSEFGIDDREYKDHARGKAGKPTTASTEALTDDNWFPKLFSDDESDWSDNQQMEDDMPILRGKKEYLVSEKKETFQQRD
ncbi:hypothetical protein QJS04_geneDACA021223 [Acorus gramineus]|uniref:RanBP2-type domain-containing protein n=1 Tax=Acorus gramineus TaxID=55184 RepID=A0AAV9AJ55_ACOGR|nr:hypothetical protein QJS04_geneDACA021223 [Acorus gramineus]